jgi:hypothetical protein
MDRERILAMDPYMLLSWINMKLRDQFSSLDYLCEDFDVEKESIEEKLRGVGYSYNQERNQFVGV